MPLPAVPLLWFFFACTGEVRDDPATPPGAPTPASTRPPTASPVPEEAAAATPSETSGEVSMVSPSPSTRAGGQAWSEHNCLACHGVRGEGGVGPQLAGTVPSLALMTQRIRAGAPPMPAFSQQDLPAHTIADLHAWLLAQPAPGPPAPSPHTISTHAGVDVELVVSGLDHPIALAFDQAGSLYVSTNGGLFPRAGQLVGQIWRIDGQRPVLFAEGLERPLGMVWLDDELIVSSRGRLAAWSDTDGDGRAEEVRVLIDDLPAAGLHQNNGVILGPDGRLYLGMGTATNAEAEPPPAGAVLAIAPDSGHFEVIATGLRNPFDLAFDADGVLYATDNAVDPDLVEAAPEELNRIEAGGFYGHPYVFGTQARDDRSIPAGLVPIPPLASLTPHASANGLLAYSGAAFPELQGKLLIAEFGSYITRFRRAGRQLTVVDPADGSIDIWAAGFTGRPLDVLAGPAGDVFVTDFEQGTVWRFFPSDRKRVAFSPSFDCARASTTVEHAICNDPQLAALDGELDAAYQEARADLDELGRRTLRDEQRAWLAVRDACEADTWPVLCVKTTVMARLEILRNAPGL